MKKTGKLMKIIATAQFMLTAVYYLYGSAGAIKLSLGVLMDENLGGNHNPFSDVSVVINIGFSTLIGIFAAILCVRLLRNKSETLALRLLYITYILFVCSTVFLDFCLFFKPDVNFDFAFGFFFRPGCYIKMIATVLIALILIVYRRDCTKKRATALVVLSSALVAFDAISRTAVFVYLSANGSFVPFNISVTYYYSLVMLYLPLLLICILKRIEAKKGDNHEIHS